MSLKFRIASFVLSMVLAGSDFRAAEAAEAQQGAAEGAKRGALVEAICPGGSAPDPSVVICLGFDQLDSCVLGRESGCFADNGLAGLADDLGHFLVVRDGIVGPGALVGIGSPGSTGPGYSGFDLPGGPYPTVNLRYYVRFHDGYMTYIYDHGPGISGAGTGCQMNGTFEQSQFYYFMYNTSNCEVGSFDLAPNVGTPPVLRNERWYLVEHQKSVDTSCTDTGSPHGCNGVMRLWIDEVLVMDYQDINWGGVTDGVLFDSIRGPRNYYHARVPPAGQKISFDNFVVSTDGETLGPAAAEGDRGTVDSMGPYQNYNGMVAFLGGHPAPDCSAGSSYLGEHFSEQWRDGGTRQSVTTHGLFVDQCENPPRADRALEVGLPGAGGGGIAWERAPDNRFSVPQHVIYGWLNIPSGSANTLHGSALAGVRAYKCGPSDCSEAQWGEYVAITLSSGNFAIVQRNGMETPVLVFETSYPLVPDLWHEFELMIWDDGLVSLMVDRTRLLNRATLPGPVAKLFDGSNPTLVVGVIDHDGGAVQIYYDDLSIGSASWWSCDGWGSETCPHGLFEDGFESGDTTAWE